MAGGYGAGDPPDPIPNSEVKTRCADGTAGATRWESTSPPTSLSQHAPCTYSGAGGVLRWYTRRAPGLHVADRRTPLSAAAGQG